MIGINRTCCLQPEPGTGEGEDGARQGSGCDGGVSLPTPSPRPFGPPKHAIRVLVDFGRMSPNRRTKPKQVAEVKEWLESGR